MWGVYSVYIAPKSRTLAALQVFDELPLDKEIRKSVIYASR